MLLEELSAMSERVRAQQNELESLRNNSGGEYAKLRKDNELWMVNAQEIMKEKEEMRDQMVSSCNFHSIGKRICS